VFPLAGPRPASAATTAAFVVILVAEPFEVDSSGCIPGLEAVEPGRNRVHICHRNRSLGPCLALGSVAEVLAARVGLPLCLGCGFPLSDLFSSIPSQGVWPLYHRASTGVTGEVWLADCLFNSGDAGVSLDPVNFSGDVMGTESLHSPINLPC
jgi:hypothetical protein